MPPKPAGGKAAAKPAAAAAKPAAAGKAAPAAKSAAAAPKADAPAADAGGGPSDGTAFQYTLECSHLPKSGANIEAMIVLSMKDGVTGKLGEKGRTEVVKSDNPRFQTQFVSLFSGDKKLQNMVFEVFDMTVANSESIGKHEYTALAQVLSGDVIAQQTVSIPMKNKKTVAIPNCALTLTVVPTTMTFAQFDAAQTKQRNAQEAKAAAEKKAAEDAAKAKQTVKGSNVMTKQQLNARVGTGAEEIEDDDYADEGFDEYGDDFEPASPKKPQSELAKSISKENANAMGAGSASASLAAQAAAPPTQSNQGGFVVPANRQFVPMVIKRETDVAEMQARSSRTRAILKQVNLHEEQFDILNMPVVPQYDVYLREISTNKKREVAAQYNDDSAAVEVQTEAPDSFDGSCQAPEDLSSGGKGEINESTGSFARFIQAASQVIRNLLLENLQNMSFTASSPGAASSAVGIQKPSGPQFEAFSSHSTEVAPPLQLGERPIRDMQFSTGRTQMLLVAYGPVMPSESNKRLAAAQLASQPRSADIEEKSGGDDMAAKSSVLRRRVVGSGGQAFEGLENRGILCLYDMLQPETPSHVMFCDGDPITCCMSPNRPHIAFAGLAEGTVVAWDLREASSLHRSVPLRAGPQQEARVDGLGGRIVLRAPSFTSEASTLIPEHGQPTSALAHAAAGSLVGHRGKVVKIVPVWEQQGAMPKANKEETADGLEMKSNEGQTEHLDLVAQSISGDERRTFQVASLDHTGVAIVWSVVELKAGDMAGSDVDLGLGIGARVKLVKLNMLTSPSPSWFDKDVAAGKAAAAAASPRSSGGSAPQAGAFSSLPANMICHDLASLPTETNEFLVAREAGAESSCLLRAARFGKATSPFEFAHSLFADEGRRSGAREVCTSLSFHPMFPEYFLGGFKSGTLCLYSLNSAAALQVWPALCEGGVARVNWSSFRPGVFFVLDGKGTLHTWDLLQTDQQAASRTPVVDVAGKTGVSSPAVFAVSNRVDPYDPVNAPPPPAAGRRDHGSALLAFPSTGNGRVAIHVLKPFLSDMIKPNEAQLFLDYITHLH